MHPKSLRLNPIPTSVNPTTTYDLVKVTSKLPDLRPTSPGSGHGDDHKLAKNESEARYRTNKRVPAGLGLDYFGVIVNDRFDESAGRPQIDSNDRISESILTSHISYNTANHG